jgi:hypothetical protein
MSGSDGPSPLGKSKEEKAGESQLIESPSKKQKSESSKIVVNVDAYSEYVE